jgi:Ribbon-helix-helix protein, copG family
MLSLRLSSDLEKRLNALVARQGITRSEWLRNAIEQQLAIAEAVTDCHRAYLQLMGPLLDQPGSGRGDVARQHSAALKQKLRENSDVQ